MTGTPHLAVSDGYLTGIFSFYSAYDLTFCEPA